jgi:hypothetical protein
MGARGALTPFRAAAAIGEAAEGAVAARAGTGILGKGLAMGARGATEGALMGAGHEVSQAALNDVPLTAEQLLAGAWDGAKLGGAFGAGLGVLGAGVGKAGRAILGRMSETGEDMGSAVGSWAERRAFKQAVGNNGKIFDKASNYGSDMARPARIGRKLLEAEMPTNSGQALRKVSAMADDSVTRLKDVAEQMDASGMQVNTEGLLGTIDDQIRKLRETPIGDFQTVADRVEKQIAPFRAKVEAAASRTGAEPVRIRLPDGTVELRPRAPAEPVRFSELWKMRQNLDKTINWEVKGGGPSVEALKDMTGAFRAELDNSISRAAEHQTVSPELLGAWKKASEDYSDFALARDGLKDLIKRKAKANFISHGDQFSGGMAGMLVGILSGNPVAGVLTSAAAGAAHKLIRERGAGVMVRIADRAASVAGKMEGAAKMAAMMEPVKRLAAPVGVNIGQQFERYSGALTEMKNDPAAFSARLASATGDLALRAPEVATKVQQTLLEDAKYLDNLHPQPSSRKSTSLTPFAVAPEYYAFDQRKAFVDAAQALDNPLGVFDDIASGELPLAGINALKARRPALWQNMRMTVVKYTMQREEELPFNRRMLLGTAFDFPSDWCMLNVSSIQQTLAEPPAQPNNPTQAPSKLNQNPGEALTLKGF